MPPDKSRVPSQGTSNPFAFGPELGLLPPPETTLREMVTQPGQPQAMYVSSTPTPALLQPPSDTFSMLPPRDQQERDQESRSHANGKAPQAVQPIAPGIIGPAQGTMRPASPTTLNGLNFKNIDQVKEFLRRPIWLTVPALWGVPTNDMETAWYVRKIMTAISSLDDVWDAEGCPWSLEKFQPGGECTDPVQVEAIAWSVVSQAISLHQNGACGPSFTSASHFQLDGETDRNATFPQRMHMVAQLLATSKLAASEVMTRQYVDKYVALPFKHLSQFTQFNETWGRLTDDQRRQYREVIPYPPFSRHPTPEEGTQLRKAYYEKLGRLQAIHSARSSLEAQRTVAGVSGIGPSGAEPSRVGVLAATGDHDANPLEMDDPLRNLPPGFETALGGSIAQSLAQEVQAGNIGAEGEDVGLFDPFDFDAPSAE
ncbi:hypothetical protein NX059_010578 [Plenodomus lindquistii]|nr:hypothetical protein NX059_010578 [Plenodomus lindquistii]